MSFRSPNCRAFSQKAYTRTLIFLGVITLTAFGVLLHSIWVLRP
jgi:hypothetical protein